MTEKRRAKEQKKQLLKKAKEQEKRLLEMANAQEKFLLKKTKGQGYGWRNRYTIDIVIGGLSLVSFGLILTYVLR